MNDRECDKFDIVEALTTQAKEIRDRGIAGWGNTMEFAADEILRLKARIKELEDAAEWRTIESVPKTRRAILVYCAESKCAFAAYWEDIDSDWCIFGGHRENVRPSPTHWMPFPKPPAEGGAS